MRFLEDVTHASFAEAGINQNRLVASCFFVSFHRLLLFRFSAFLFTFQVLFFQHFFRFYYSIFMRFREEVTHASFAEAGVILHFAFKPFAVLAVIVTVPAFSAVTTPLLLTLAIF